MAKKYIVTDLLASELDSLISNSGLVRGLQYNVTDKNWKLIATKVNECKPINGKLKIVNGETIPIGVVPDIVYIDTGEISSVNDLDITISDNYIPFSYTVNTVLEDIREEYAFSPALIKDMAEEIKQESL